MDPALKDPAAVLVRGDRIAVVGSVERVLDAAASDTVWYDLEGRALLPGFNDNHFHAVSGGLRDKAADLSGLDADAIIQSVQAQIDASPAGSYVQGYGWDYTACPNPHRSLLDEHFPDIPVFLTQFSGHAVWTNTRGLELMGLLTKQTTRGETVLFDDNGPTGIVREAGRNRYLRKQYRKRSSDPEKIRTALKTILAGLARAGITTVQDNTWYRKPIEVLKELKQDGELTCRFSCWSRDEVPFTESWVSAADFDEDWFHPGPRKLFFDGAFSSHSAWLFDEYVDEPGNFGSGQSADEIYKMLAPHIRRKRQVACHAIGDRAVHEFCIAVERLAGRYPWTKDLRIRIEHGQLIREDDIKRIADLGMLACAQASALGDPEKDLRLLGPERTKSVYPHRSLLDSGVRLSFGSDYPGEPFYEPLRGIDLAVNRESKERITVEEALACYTRESAYAERKESSKGSITPGKLADFVILSDDPLSIPATDMRKLRVLQTIVGGEAVYAAETLAEIKPGVDV